ncbi:MAG: NAD-dependent malic enzyme [Deltaproteobacteria bacterium]|nr:NAD-dependent malic enzyme [Kofleriaceae bacterium]
MPHSAARATTSPSGVFTDIPSERPPLSAFFDIVRGPDGQDRMVVTVEGIALLRLVLINKGTAFTREERAALGLDGLLPPQVNDLEMQIARAYRHFCGEPTRLAKYQYLRGLQERQEILFYAVLERHLEEMLPIVYTPTVGEAVQKFSQLYQNPRGLSLSPENIDRADEILARYPLNDVRMIVATDSSAILGIGDQGWGGLAIPIGKLALYTCGGGVSPYHTMPVALDVGTDRDDLLADPLYLGTRRRRLRGGEYVDFVEKFVRAVARRWPRAVIQWEDLAKDTAFTVLERFRGQHPSFNDDIQGTGAVALAGVTSAARLLGRPLREQVFVVHGAGAGGAGVAEMIARGLVADGLTWEQARARLYVLDSRGLLVDDRPLDDYKRRFAQPRERIAAWGAGAAPDLLATVTHAKATALLGLSGTPGAFTEEVVRATLRNTPRPIVFPLSNPTTSAEATPADVLAWTDGAAFVAAGSPFAPVTLGDTTHAIPQGNNAFVFPGLGAGAIACSAARITDAMVMAAARAVSDYTAAHHPDALYPPVSSLPLVSRVVAVAVIEAAIRDGVADPSAGSTAPADLAAAHAWQARYLPVVRR